MRIFWLLFCTSRKVTPTALRDWDWVQFRFGDEEAISKPISFLAQKKRVLDPKENRFGCLRLLPVLFAPSPLMPCNTHELLSSSNCVRPVRVVALAVLVVAFFRPYANLGVFNARWSLRCLRQLVFRSPRLGQGREKHPATDISAQVNN